VKREEDEIKMKIPCQRATSPQSPTSLPPSAPNHSGSQPLWFPILQL